MRRACYVFALLTAPLLVAARGPSGAPPLTSARLPVVPNGPTVVVRSCLRLRGSGRGRARAASGSADSEETGTGEDSGDGSPEPARDTGFGSSEKFELPHESLLSEIEREQSRRGSAQQSAGKPEASGGRGYGDEDGEGNSTGQGEELVDDDIDDIDDTDEVWPEVSFHSSSEALPEKKPINWTAGLLSRDSMAFVTPKNGQEGLQNVSIASFMSKWFDSEDENKIPHDSKAEEEKTKEGRGNTEKGDGMATGRVKLAAPKRGAKVQPLLIPPSGRDGTGTADKGTLSKYDAARHRISQLLGDLEQDGGGDSEDSVGESKNDAETAHSHSADRTGSRKPGSGSSRATVGDVLMSEYDLDDLISQAAAGQVDAMAAVGIRIIFNGETPSQPLSAQLLQTQDAGEGGTVDTETAPLNSHWAEQVGEEDVQVGRLGLPLFPQTPANGAGEMKDGSDRQGVLEEEAAGSGFSDASVRQALVWLREAAANNVTAAQRSLGHCYMHGLGVVEDARTAVAWIGRAAKAGDGGAQFDMGRAWEEGVGVSSNISKALACYSKAAAAGWPDGHLFLGHAAAQGLRDGKVDIWEAIDRYAQAAGMGSSEAWQCLGALYFSGVGDKAGAEFKLSQTMAFRCWREAAALGEATAMHALGMMYLKGIKVRQDDRKAFAWLRRSALAGNSEAAVAAGLMCEVGRGVTARSESRALNYLLFGADSDSPQALLHAGRLLLSRHKREHAAVVDEEEYGEGDECEGKDWVHALRFLRRATDMGLREAFFLLTRALCEGTVKQRREAKALLLAAADKGDTHAMFHCALWFLDGEWTFLEEGGTGIEAGMKGARHRGLGRGETVIEKEEAEESEDVSGFVAAEAFSGRKEGYSFKSGTLGLGYYRDVSANSQHPHPETNQATGVTTQDKHVVSALDEGPAKVRTKAGYTNELGERLKSDQKQGWQWLQKAAQQKHPLASSLFNMLELTAPDGVRNISNGVHGNIPPRPASASAVSSAGGEVAGPQGYAGAGRFLDLEQEAQMALAAQAAASTPEASPLVQAMRAQPLIAERLVAAAADQNGQTQGTSQDAHVEPLSSVEGSISVADRLAKLRKALHAVLEVTQDELLGRVLTEATGPAASRFRAIHAHGRRMRRGKNDGGIEARARELFEIGAEKMGVLKERPACRKRRRAG